MPSRKSKKTYESPPVKELSIRDMPFSRLVVENQYLAELRTRCSRKSVKQRREAATFEYHEAESARFFSLISGIDSKEEECWWCEVRALAIDPKYAPAILTIGTLEYLLQRRKEGIGLLMNLAGLPRNTEDLETIIDKAGDFLLDNNDIDSALMLYTKASKTYPDVALYHNAIGYCLSKQGDHEKAVDYVRKAVELEPDNYIILNDLGWTLMETGKFDEAKDVLEKAVTLSPREYKLARGNLEYLKSLQKSTRGTKVSIPKKRKKK